MSQYKTINANMCEACLEILTKLLWLFGSAFGLNTFHSFQSCSVFAKLSTLKMKHLWRNMRNFRHLAHIHNCDVQLCQLGKQTNCNKWQLITAGY